MDSKNKEEDLELLPGEENFITCSLESLFKKLKVSEGKMATSESVSVTSLILTHIAPLKRTIDELTSRIQSLTASDSVREYTPQIIDDSIRCDEALDVIKSLPSFDGNESAYVSWREAAVNSMQLYKKGSRRYYAALSILRNKITDEANDMLTNHGTVLNMDAILARLDFAYADRRPLHLIEQELSVMRQGTLSIIDYYNDVNKKLTSLINKTIMTHGSNEALTKELNNKNRQYALRVFITGLNSPLADILFSLSPSDLPNALAKAQELESNNMRANFARQFNKQNHTFNTNNQTNRTNNNFRNYTNNKFHNHLRVGNPNTRLMNSNHNLPKPEPMEVGSSANITRGRQNNYNNYRPQQQNRFFGFNNNLKRANSDRTNFQPQTKAQRINNISETAFLEENPDSRTLLNREQPEENIQF